MAGMMLQNDHYDYLFKLILVGDMGVGKSCLVLRFADDIYAEDTKNTIGVDFKISTVEVDGKICKLQIWDTPGQERYHALTSSYYRNAMGIIVVYSVIDRESFNHVKDWMQEIDDHAAETAIKLLIANKSDVFSSRKVKVDEGMRLADSLGMHYMETSAKEGRGVKESFQQMAREIKANLATLPQELQTKAINIGKGQAVPQSSCPC